jgi:predicted ribosome quality control (RQC) complex YloA/Tae2 family protein
MLTNYHTLGYVAAALQATLPGRRIESIFTQNPDELVILFGGGDAPALVFACDAQLNTAYLQENFARARANTVDLLPEAHGAAVLSVALHGADRIIIVSLGNGRRLLLEFFGPHANALLCASDGRILDAFRNGGALAGTLHTPRTGEITYDLSLLESAYRTATGKQAFQILRTTYPSLGATLAREILHRAGVSPGSSAPELSSAEIIALRSALSEVLSQLSRPSPRIYLSPQGAPKVFSLIPLLHRTGEREEICADLNSGIRRYVIRSRAGSELEERLSALRLPLQNQLAKLERTLGAMGADAREAERAEEYERFGQLLMSSLPSIRKGERVFHAGDAQVPLDPARTPVQNAQRYFERAKKARTAAEESRARIAGAEQRAGAARRLLEALDAVADRAELDELQRSRGAELEEFGLTPRAQERARLPFRLFVVDGGFEVWAGKNNANNDLLTLRHAKPDDLWFHARGSSGSHVVLKVSTGKGEPGKRAKEEAAAIAAYYSRAKGASMVPVAMTERRYVRKPKGAPPGTVSIERERVLFVRPGLPHPEVQ